MNEEKDEDELRTRRGVFLQVEGSGDTVTETSVKGERTTYSQQLRPETIGIGDFRVSQTVDAKTGEGRYFIAGRTEAKFRALGTEGAYQRDVRISTDLPPNKMRISKTYAKDGHSLSDIGKSIVIGASERAIETIVRELRGAPSLRKIDIVLAQPSFFGPQKQAQDGFLHDDILLPYWSNQPKQTHEHGIRVEWDFEVSAIVVVPEYRHFGDERSRSAESVHARISDRLKVYYDPPSEGAASLDDLFQRLIEATRVVGSLRTPLYLTGIAAALIAYKLMWGSH